MNAALESLLKGMGAVVADGEVRDFGDAAAERAMMPAGSYVADLSHFGVLEFGGPDATEFLHNQVTCDVKALAAGVSTPGAYCTPKGRMLASFLLWRRAEGWRMLLPRSVLPATLKRLRMFVLRSKVMIADCTDTLALLGAGGPASAQALRECFGNLPEAPRGTLVPASAPDADLLSLPGGRWLLALPPDRAASAWPALARQLRPVGSAAWDWTDIRNGIAFVGARTQEQFIPQMANLELIGGVSFKKGCYPGQEIVARTQHLGKVKRRLYLANVQAAAVPGDELFGEDFAGQSNGMVAGAAPSPWGGTDVLAVVQRASAESSRVHLRSADGPALDFQPLPYAIP
ncbi:MAG: folate-binding protein YgfZ [Betaproteobacteria bacterium]|nr:folate-binding protein YgfZ [Betaproteobacteria bacterium]